MTARVVRVVIVVQWFTKYHPSAFVTVAQRLSITSGICNISNSTGYTIAVGMLQISV